jgi:hypothetical protein
MAIGVRDEAQSREKKGVDDLLAEEGLSRDDVDG